MSKAEFDLKIFVKLKETRAILSKRCWISMSQLCKHCAIFLGTPLYYVTS